MRLTVVCSVGSMQKSEVRRETEVARPKRHQHISITINVIGKKTHPITTGLKKKMRKKNVTRQNARDGNNNTRENLENMRYS